MQATIIYFDSHKLGEIVNAKNTWNCPEGQVMLHATHPLKSHGETAVQAIPEVLKWNAYYTAGVIEAADLNEAYAITQNVDHRPNALGKARSMSIGDIIVISDKEAFIVDDIGFSPVPEALIKDILIAGRFGKARRAVARAKKAIAEAEAALSEE